MLSDINRYLLRGQPLPKKVTDTKSHILGIIEEAKNLGFLGVVDRKRNIAKVEDYEKIRQSKRSEFQKEMRNEVLPSDDEDIISHSAKDYQEQFEKSIRTPFPEEWSPALPFLREAHRLEKEGADSERVKDVLEKARQVDSEATNYYIARWSIMKKRMTRYIKIGLDESNGGRHR